MTLTCLLLAAANLLLNPSFEDWKEGAPLPEHWTTHDRVTLSEKISRVEGGADDGRYCVRIANGRTGNALRQRIPVVPGKYYDLNCRVKMEIPFFEFYFANHWETAEGKYVHNVTKLAKRAATNGKFDWRDLGAKNLRAPDGVKYLVVELFMNDSGSGNDVCGWVQIDSVSVTESADVSASEEAYRPYLAVPLAAGADWANAPVVSRLVAAGTGSPDGAQTEFRVLVDKDALRFRSRAERLPTTTRPERRDARDKAGMTDIVECFFKPDLAVDRQYHLVFDGIGNVWDYRQSYITNTVLPKGVFVRASHDASWTAEGLKSAVREEGDGAWTLEASLPWKAIGRTSPKAGDELRANFCRADYGKSGTTHLQLNEWAVQKIADFSDWRDFGTLAFVEDCAVVMSAEIRPGSSAVDVTVAAGARDRSLRVLVEEFTADGVKVRLGEASAAVSAGATKTLGVALSSRASLAWISVFDGDRLVFRRGGRAAGKSFEVGLRDPLNVRKRHIMIPNDTRWPNIFCFTHTVPVKGGFGLLPNTPELGLRFFAEVPEGVALEKILYSPYGGDRKVENPLASERITRDGKPWTRYELPVFVSKVNCPMLFLTSTLASGTKGSVYLYLTWKGGSQAPTEFPFEVVSFGRVKPFARMQFRLDDMTYNYAHAICDDPAKELPTLGVNILKVPMYPDAAGRATTDRWMKEIAASGRAWKFSVQNDLNDALRYWCNETSWGNHLKMKPDESGVFRNLDGRPRRNPFGWNSPCLMYRGENYRKQVEGIANSYAVREKGVNWLVLDWEFWDQNACYCDRCVKELWPDYLRQHGLPDYGDPRVFMQKPRENRAAAKAWEAMYASHRGRIYSDLKRDLKAATGKDFILSDWVCPRPHLVAGMDYFDWAFAYYGPEASMSRLCDVYTNVLHGSSEKLVCALNSMQGCEMNDQYPPKATYYNILEAATAGVRGFEWWYMPSFRAEDWKYVMDGLKMIRPFEDLILDGKVTIHGDGENCTWRKVACGDEALYCVRNYELKKPMRASFVVKASVPGELVDVETGKVLAKLRRGANRITLDLSPDRPARFLYAGEKFESRKKILQ